MNLLNVTMPVSLFIFFLGVALIIGLLIAFWASASAVNASYREHDRDKLKIDFTGGEMKVEYKSETFS